MNFLKYFQIIHKFESTESIANKCFFIGKALTTSSFLMPVSLRLHPPYTYLQTLINQMGHVSIDHLGRRLLVKTPYLKD